MFDKVRIWTISSLYWRFWDAHLCNEASFLDFWLDSNAIFEIQNVKIKNKKFLFKMFGYDPFECFVFLLFLQFKGWQQSVYFAILSLVDVKDFKNLLFTLDWIKKKTKHITNQHLLQFEIVFKLSYRGTILVTQ